MKFFIPETRAYRTSASYDLFPQHCQLPTLTEQQHNKEVAQEWIESIQRLKNKPKKAAIKSLKKAIETITNGGAVPATEGERAATEGVQTPAAPVTTSTNPTNPRVLRKKTRMHLKHTRRKTPGASPLIVGGMRRSGGRHGCRKERRRRGRQASRTARASHSISRT